MLAVNVYAVDVAIKTDTMNGYKLSTYQGFEKKWKLVTVRFRKDTGEMRFTFANDLAYKNLLKGSTDYPDGSVFAKVSHKTQEDSAFTSSAVPSGARRYQYMVRNKKLHASTDGWGYALFDSEGLVYPEKIDVQSNACAACHRVIPERGFVFSQLMELKPGKGIKKSLKNPGNFESKITYESVDVAAIDEVVRKLFPKNTKTVRKLTHEISKYLFQGTLDEIKPTLTKEAILSKVPAIIISDDQKTFSFVFVENFEVSCDAEGKTGYFVKAVSSSVAQKGKLSENRYCWVD